MTSHNDENLGHGGSYIMQDGVRVLVERTQSPQDVAEFLNRSRAIFRLTPRRWFSTRGRKVRARVSAWRR